MNCMVNNETQHLVQIVSVDLVHLIVHKYISFIFKKKSEREREREGFFDRVKLLQYKYNEDNRLRPCNLKRGWLVNKLPIRSSITF